MTSYWVAAALLLGAAATLKALPPLAFGLVVGALAVVWAGGIKTVPLDQADFWSQSDDDWDRKNRKGRYEE